MIRRAALVTLVWALAALPFLTGNAYCPSARFFHVACPGCGMTRALTALVRGDIAGSLAYHAFAVPTVLAQAALAVASIAAAFWYGFPWAIPRLRGGRLVLVGAAAVAVLDLVFWVARGLGAFGGPVHV